MSAVTEYICWCDGDSCTGRTTEPFTVCDECKAFGHRPLASDGLDPQDAVAASVKPSTATVQISVEQLRDAEWIKDRLGATESERMKSQADDCPEFAIAAAADAIWRVREDEENNDSWDQGLAVLAALRALPLQQRVEAMGIEQLGKPQTFRYIRQAGEGPVEVRELTDRHLAPFATHEEAVGFMRENGWAEL